MTANAIPVVERAGSDAPAEVSLLHPRPARPPGHRLDAETAHDLFLDQVIDRLARGRLNKRAGDLFAIPLADVGTIRYRQDVFRDLESQQVFETLIRFSDGMQAVQGRLAAVRSLRHAQEREHWHLHAALDYVAAVHALAAGLDDLELGSDGLSEAREAIRCYAGSSEFQRLAADAHETRKSLDSVRYRLRIHAGSVQVTHVVDNEPDYTADVLATFARFREQEGTSRLARIESDGSMNHVEAAIAGFVARLFPETYAKLHEFFEQHGAFLDAQIERLHADAQFYLGYLDLVTELAKVGVRFCLPELSEDGGVAVEGGIDLALALSVLDKQTRLVANDCVLDPEERLLVVTGPNQGGKTTYARLVGQLHHLTSLGVPVPARHARVPIVDRVLSLFERGENLADQRGHLYDDLVRARDILTSAGPESLVILNEVFSSTTLDDAVLLGREVLSRLRDTGARCVCVTFLDELTDLGEGTVSAVASVDPDDPTRRTFQIVRRPADGLAYAHALAEKYRVDYTSIKNRMDR